MSSSARKSKLVPIGLSLVVVSFGVGGNLGGVMSGMSDINVDALLDLLRALFLVGITCLVTGIVRNRRRKRRFELGNAAR
jgi:hypothetical protein